MKTPHQKWMPSVELFDEETVDQARRLVSDLKRHGINISSETTFAQLRQGYGEGVCLILNELINQELVRRDFHFETPEWDHDKEPCAEVVDEVDDAEGEEWEGSEPEESDNDQPEVNLSTTWDEVPTLRPGTPTMEPIHTTNVSAEEWAEELQRVKSQLRVTVDLSKSRSDWSQAIAAAKQLCNGIEAASLASFIMDSSKACCTKWREELARLKRHEENLNSIFSEQVSEISQLRKESVTETQRLSTLQEHVAELSETLSNISRQADDAKAEASEKGEAMHDAQHLQNLKKALLRMRMESKELGTHLGLLRVELFSRQMHPHHSS